METKAVQRRVLKHVNMVEAEGPIETSVARPSRRGAAVDQKESLMVRELKKYGERDWDQ